MLLHPEVDGTDAASEAPEFDLVNGSVYDAMMENHLSKAIEMPRSYCSQPGMIVGSTLDRFLGPEWMFSLKTSW
jgi:hypothetical protein